MRGPGATLCAKERGESAIPAPTADNMPRTFRRDRQFSADRNSGPKYSGNSMGRFTVAGLALERRFWGERRGLNPRPSVPQTDALPAELRSPQMKYTQFRPHSAFSKVAQPLFI